MNNPNRDRLTREQFIQCYYAKFQLDCAFAECDEKCPILQQVYQNIRERVNTADALIEVGGLAAYDLTSPAACHARNMPGANFPKEVQE